jgi:uncharacterized phage protein (TIGR02218 family)
MVMAFNDIEISEYDSHAIELYHFKRGGFSWRYTSSDENITFKGLLYSAVKISRGRIEATQDLGKVSLKVSMSRRVEFASQFIADSPTDVISIDVTRIHSGEVDEAITWRGRVINVSFSEDEAEIICQPIYTSLKRPGLRRLYQLTCPHVLYGDQCTLVKNDFLITANVSAVTNNIITAPELIIAIDATYNPDWFLGGFIEFSESSLITRRFITNHDNNAGSITLNSPVSSITTSSQISVYPGCDHAVSTCNGKFSNVLNFGGCPFIPEKNPMDGTSIF